MTPETSADKILRVLTTNPDRWYDRYALAAATGLGDGGTYTNARALVRSGLVVQRQETMEERDARVRAGADRASNLASGRRMMWQAARSKNRGSGRTRRVA